MKRLLRIAFGLIIFPIPLIIGTLIWVFEFNEASWIHSVGEITWNIISGQWEKLPE